MTLERFLEWNKTEEGCGLVGGLLQVILEVCHVKMGLRPSTVKEEMSVIRYMYISLVL